MASAFFTRIFHDIPHFTFALKQASKSFAIELDSDYFKSLVVFLVFALFVGGILLLTIIVTWICQCCTRRDPTVKSRRRVRQMSTLLFIISVFCFFALGICLFANEHINRGLTTSIGGLEDVNYNFKLANVQRLALSETFTNATRHVNDLSRDVDRQAAESPDIDKKALMEAQTAISALNTKISTANQELTKVDKILSNVAFLERSKGYASTIEFERWVLLVTLLSIMLIVLFIGVIAFCRQSKKGTVMFSGLGFAIFIFGWLLLAVVFPSTIALADFCSDGGSFIKQRLSEETITTLVFYQNCEPAQTHDNSPPVMKVKEVSGELSDIQKGATHLDSILHKLFNDTQQVSDDIHYISDDVTRALKSVGALETRVACYAYHDDLSSMKQGLCDAGMFGAGLLTSSLLALSLLMFILLLIVSKSWYLFKQLPSDYVEVDDEDPFFPRGNDSTIPVDIYGTHVYNPRTRYANSLDRTEPSTGTTIAAGIPNGSTSTQPSASTALLAGESEWHRATAPPTNPALFNSPPAYGEVGVLRKER